jgi:hypothetical protein
VVSISDPFKCRKYVVPPKGRYTVIQDKVDLGTLLHVVMEPRSNTWCPLCYRTLVLDKLSIMVFKGLYPNTPPVPEGTYSGEFKSWEQNEKRREECTRVRVVLRYPPTFGV